jgi:serine/threonine protein kinase
MEREIQIISHLYHKNIVKYHGVQHLEQSINIILEYCIGGSIAKIIHTYKKLQEKLVRKYLKQILEGLEYLHSNNIIHRGKSRFYFYRNIYFILCFHDNFNFFIF